MFGQQTKTNGRAAAPTGMTMMLKAIGFDPETFARNMEAAKQAAVATVNHFDARLTTIEATQIVILEKQAELAGLLNYLLCQMTQK